jgi:acetoin utilization deacetylase AcuC-like enzyme
MFTGGLAKPHPDVPDRVAAITTELRRNGAGRFVDAGPAGVQEVSACHDPEYLCFLEKVCDWLAESGEADAVLGPRAFPFRRWGRRPNDLLAQTSFYSSDMETPIDRSTWEAALSSAGAALTGARIATTGSSPVYAVCRPPGHHAGRDWCGGFCYVNNTAVAACFLAQSGRVGILDIDYHHGNGTQDIFYESPDVLFVSIHADPNYAYPYFCGYSDERGRGHGEGFNHNLPLELGATSSHYFPALREGLDSIREFAPEHLVVSLGTDTAADDPIGKFALDAGDFSAIGEHIASLGTPVLVVQEGGYNLATIGVDAAAFIDGLCQ